MADMVESRARVIGQMCSAVMVRWRERSVPVSMVTTRNMLTYDLLIVTLKILVIDL